MTAGGSGQFSAGASTLIKQRTNQPISDVNLKKLTAELQQRGEISIAEGKVTYTF